jgi:predicted type IV restriction endonuclease
MFWRDYEYSMQGIDPEKALNYERNKSMGLVITDYRYWFVLTNDRPYNKAKDKTTKIEHYTIWSKDNLISGLSCKEMGKIIFQRQSAGFTIIMNSKEEQSIVSKPHFHALRIIKDEKSKSKTKSNGFSFLKWIKQIVGFRISTPAIKND